MIQRQYRKHRERKTAADRLKELKVLIKLAKLR